MERYLKREQNELDHSERVWQEIPWRMFCLGIGEARWFGSNPLARSGIRSFYERSMYFLNEIYPSSNTTEIGVPDLLGSMAANFFSYMAILTCPGGRILFNLYSSRARQECYSFSTIRCIFEPLW
jgi:hypothetical protein